MAESCVRAGRRIRAVLFFAFVVLAAAGFAAQHDALELRYDEAKCGVEAVTSLVEYGENSANLSSNGSAGKLTDDLAVLGVYAGNGDEYGFGRFAKNDLKNDVHAAALFLAQARRILVENGNSGMVEYYAGGERARAQCMKNAALKYSHGKEIEMIARIAGMEQDAGKLRNKSANMSAMEAVLAKATANLQEYRNAAANASGADALSPLIGEHLHIWARFQAAKLRAILELVRPEAEARGHGGEAHSIQSLLEDAEARAAAGKAYESQDFEIAKNDLRLAGGELGKLIKEIS